MLRCAASFVVATYAKVRLTPHDLRALPLNVFEQPLKCSMCHSGAGRNPENSSLQKNQICYANETEIKNNSVVS
jgi:hypothetical protein